VNTHLKNLFRKIESSKFDAEVNIASGWSTARNIVARDKNVRELLDLVTKDGSLQREVLNRIHFLSTTSTNPNYEHPHDVAIASYLMVLGALQPYVDSPFYSTCNSFRTAVQIREKLRGRCWWAIRQAEEMIQGPKKKQGPYCCVLAPVPKVISESVIEWGKKHISDSILFTEHIGYKTGRILDSHLTAKWGLANNGDINDVQAIVERRKPLLVTLGNVQKFNGASTYEGEEYEYDPIFIEAHSPDLHDLHEELCKIPDSIETHSKYQPHLTIAYVHPGAADNLIGSSAFAGIEFLIDSVVFKGKDGISIDVQFDIP